MKIKFVQISVYCCHNLLCFAYEKFEKISEKCGLRLNLLSLKCCFLPFYFQALFLQSVFSRKYSMYSDISELWRGVLLIFFRGGGESVKKEREQYNISIRHKIFNRFSTQQENILTGLNQTSFFYSNQLSTKLQYTVQYGVVTALTTM